MSRHAALATVTQNHRQRVKSVGQKVLAQRYSYSIAPADLSQAAVFFPCQRHSKLIVLVLVSVSLHILTVLVLVLMRDA